MRIPSASWNRCIAKPGSTTLRHTRFRGLPIRSWWESPDHSSGVEFLKDLFHPLGGTRIAAVAERIVAVGEVVYRSLPDCRRKFARSKPRGLFVTALLHNPEHVLVEDRGVTWF